MENVIDKKKTKKITYSNKDSISPLGKKELEYLSKCKGVDNRNSKGKSIFF